MLGLLGSIAAPLIGGLLGGSGSKQSGTANTNTTTTHKLDPRMDAMLFGSSNGGGPQTGLLSRYQGMLDQQQNDSLQRFSNTNANYLDWMGAADMGNMRNAALGMMNGNAAPTMQAAGLNNAPAYAVGSTVKAPSQNNLDLSGSYNSLINGPAGANPHLMGAIQKGINQSTNAFQDMQRGATQNLMENIMPGIRSNSVLAGQYGGSRQGIAEGRALGDFATGMTQAMGRFGQNNTDAAVAAQAGAYDADRNRQLAATQGLGAQQYGVAHQNAANEMAAQMMNVNQHNATNEAQANRNQAANLANMQSQLTTNAQNASGALGGAGLLGGLLSGVTGNLNAQDNRGINRAAQVNSLIAPYINANSTTTSNGSQPLYENRGAGFMGGALIGDRLFGGGNQAGIGDLFGANGLFGKNSYF